MGPRAFAQTPGGTAVPAFVSILAIEVGGKIVPIEQFEAHVDDSCKAAAAQPTPHFHARGGASVIALDLTPVADPDPNGCGFGIVLSGAGSADVHVVQVSPAEIAAWTKRTGVEPAIIGTSDKRLPDSPAVTPTGTTPAGATQAASGSRVFAVLGVALVCAIGTGLAAGAFIYRRERRVLDIADAEAVRAASAAIEETDVNDSLARAHRGMLVTHDVSLASTAPVATLEHEPISRADDDEV